MDIIKAALGVSPVPGLQLAFTIFQSIWASVQEAQAFKEQLQVLVTCTATLLRVLNNQYRTGQLTEESTYRQLQDLKSLLEGLANFVQLRSSCSFLRLLFVKDQSLATIDAYQQKISTMIQAFQISALVNIRNWQRENENARKVDQKNLCSQLAALAANQRLLAKALNVEENNPMAMMATFKKRIEEKKGEREELAFFTQSLLYLSTTSGQVDLKPWTISPFDVEFGEVIGGGGFGVVCRGRWNQTEVALKVMKNAENMIPRPSAVLREIETWSKLRHPHILQFFGANVLDDKPFIVMPLIANGNVRDYINNNPNCDRLRLIKQVALGLVYLHSQGIIHGDLKGFNILVDEGEKALLCDFGLSRIKADINSRSSTGNLSSPVGSPHWMAPELFKGEVLRFPCDVYSFAMTMYELFTNEIPFGHLALNMLRDLVVAGTRPGRPDMDEAPQLSDEVWSIIELCWEAAPKNRPTADAVLNKLKNTLSLYPPAIPSNRLPGISMPIQRMSAQSLSLKGFEPISCPVPDVPKPIRPRISGNGGVFSRILRTKAALPPMAEAARQSLTLANPESVTSTVQSSDGKFLIAGLSDGSCNMWYLNNASKIPQDVKRPFDPVTAIKFDRSTSTYAAGFNSGHIIYQQNSLSDCPSTFMLTGNNEPILCLHVFNITVMALICPQNKVPVIIKWCHYLRRNNNDIAYRVPLPNIAPSSCVCAAFSPDGKEIYIGTSDGSLFICAASDGHFVHQPFRLPVIHSTIVECKSLALSPDGKKIMVSYSSGEIRLWDLKTKSHSVLRFAGALRSSDTNSLAYSSLPVTFSPDGSYVAYASATDPSKVNIQDVVSKKVLSSIRLDDSPTDVIQSLDISPNNKRLIVTFHNSNRIMVCEWD